MPSVLRRLAAATRYSLLGLPLAIPSFALLIAGLAAGLATVAFYLGLPILAGTLLVARGFADVERRRLAELSGHPVPRPRYAPPPAGAGRFRRMVNPLTGGQSWLDLLHGIITFPFAIIGFVVTVTWWSVAVAGLLYPVYGWILSNIPGNHGLPELLGVGEGYLWDTAFNMGIGLFFTLTLPLIVPGVTAVQAGLARGLLTGVAALQERIEDLTEGRAAAVSAEAGALRRLERDIHDGPQQRLVHLAMELSRAQRQLQRDPQAAHATLSEAITATRETLDELRALSRGIAPPILSDRGLAPALAALAGRCTVPVELDVQTVERYPAVVENTVYYVAAESLTNIAKHSRAQLCTLSLTRVGDALTLAIGDDGVGGAHVAKGHGLAGLADRLRAVDGELLVRSPAGGPTLIIAEVPCG
ncbi:histidine kinase [Sphaerisporangium rufum]|uniref:histidine kinase n=1 Tax=Sphaerisporangium rufum TaxID=1381558 RepID=A0A919R6T2_9ACTN|nr:sensor histidine kinase [Sphaerisporangium rufum]GII80313.1 histidine kinase [Sphaerisporangium rufum]